MKIKMLKTKTLNKTIITILITLLTISMLSAVIPMVSAAISVTTVVPILGPVGTTVTITGAGASAGGQIIVYWQNLAGAVLNNTAYADGTGAYSVMVTIPTPAAGGNQSIIVQDASTGVTAGAIFAVTPTLTLAPTAGIVGDNITVTGTGYPASSNVGIFYNSTVLFATGGTSGSTIEWSANTTYPADSTQANVANITNVDGGNALVGVVIPGVIPLNAFDPTKVQFSYNGTQGLWEPEMELRFTAPNNSIPGGPNHIDIMLAPVHQVTVATGTWTTATYTSPLSMYYWMMNADGSNKFRASVVSTWAELVTALKADGDVDMTNAEFGTWNLTRIGVQVGSQDPGATRKWCVDYIKYDTTTYNLEPATQTVSSTSSGSISTSFTVPSSFATGANIISGINTTDISNYISTTATFTVGPAITLTPTEGPSGTVVTIAGRGFTLTADIVIGIKIGGTTCPLVAVIKTLVTGNFTGQFIIPSKATGTYSVVALEASGGSPASASASFNVTGPTAITLTPTAGPVITTVVTITGANFTAIAGKTVTVVFGSVTVLTTSTNATGGFSGTFSVPPLGTGAHTVTATDANSLTASKTFTIAVTFLGVSPVIGPTGTVATVTCYGFTGGGTANVTIGTTRVLTNIAVSTLESGTTFKVPTLPVATYTVTAIDNLGLTASTSFEVNATTQLTLTPSSATRGSTVAVTTHYFTAVVSTVMTFNIRNSTWNTSLTLSASAGYTGQQTLVNGTYKGTFTVSTAWALGSYTINASDANGLMVDASFNVVLATTTLTLNPTESLIGAVVTATAANFQASTPVTIYFGSTLVLNVSSTAGGALPTATNFTVPNVSYGTYTVTASDGVNSATATFNVLGISEIDTILTMLDDIEAKLDEGGTFYTFVDNWFTYISTTLAAIKAKTDIINWADITAIKTAVTHVSTRKFDFGTTTSLWEPGFVQATPSTSYTASQGYGWTNTTGLYARDRGAPDYTRRDFVFSSDEKTFQVDLTNGDYTVIVTLGDQSYSHDNMNITVEGSSALVNNTAGTFVQKVFHVTVADGSLTVTIKDDGRADINWVINTLIIEQSWK